MKLTVIFWAVILLSWCEAAPDKLLANTKAPSHARSSAVARALSGQTPANVGRLPQSKPSSVPSSGGTQQKQQQQQQQQQQDDVQREEITSFKEVNGETVSVVLGNYAYQSPEGLPVSFKYMADENGNKASFTIGAAAAAGSGSKSKPGGTGVSQRPGTASPIAGTKGNQSSKNAIGSDGDRTYLPPT